MTIQHRATIPPTPEQDTEGRLQQIERNHGLIPAFNSKGVRLTSRGYDYVVLNPEILGLEPPATDDDCGESKLPRVRRRGLYLPTENRTMTPRETCDIWMKTPQKKREFLEGCTREPELTRYIVVEAGENFDRRAIVTAPSAKLAEAEALKRTGVTHGEPFRAVEVMAYDDEAVSKVVEEQRVALPWNEAIALRPDGSFPVGWHGCQLDGQERLRLADQQSADRRAKRERRDRVIRAMMREPI